MILRTFDAWSKLGFQIIKGSKAIWIEGVPMYADTQVIHRFIIAEYDEEEPVYGYMYEKNN